MQGFDQIFNLFQSEVLQYKSKFPKGLIKLSKSQEMQEKTEINPEKKKIQTKKKKKKKEQLFCNSNYCIEWKRKTKNEK